jgi:AhpD family alkylhydroperoxidase
MPRIAYAQEGQEAPGAAPVYREFKERFGRVTNLMKLLGHSGPATQALGAILRVYFAELALSPRLREIAYLTAARYNGCQYCQAHHTRLAKRAGLDDSQIALLGPEGFESEKLPEAERAVVRFAYETTRDVRATDEAVEALTRHFEPSQVAEIAFVVAAANFIQRIGRNFGAELEQA